MERQVRMSRRRFIGATAVAAAAMAYAPQFSLGIESGPTIGKRRTDNEKVLVGCIGIGWQGGGNMNSFLNHADCRVVAVCDVDQHHLDAALNAVNGHYGDSACSAYGDFQKLLERDDLDAVCISTPDQWHSIPAIQAAEAGLDIYCEKPLSHSLGEGIAMVRAVQKNERIWQTGSWQRSQAFFRWAAEMVQNGYLGKVSSVEVGLPSGHINFAGIGPDVPNSEAPDYVDYDQWVGPAKMMPFNAARFHKNWRWNYNFGGGQLMDWIGHHCDIAHWGLANPEYGCGPDDKIAPLEVLGESTFPACDAVWNTATKYKIACKYPNDVDLLIAGGYEEVPMGVKWIGPKGWIFVSRGTIRASDPNMIRDIQKREKEGNLPIQLYKSPGHVKEFVASVSSRKQTLTPVEVAHRSQTPGHLGYISSRLGRKIEWDGKKQEIIGDAEASKLAQPKIRTPWKL